MTMFDWLTSAAYDQPVTLDQLGSVPFASRYGNFANVDPGDTNAYAPQAEGPIFAPSQVGTSPAGVGYVPPSAVAQGATTNPALLQPQRRQPSFLANFLTGMGAPRAAAAPQMAPFRFATQPVTLAMIGQRRQRAPNAYA